MTAGTMPYSSPACPPAALGKPPWFCLSRQCPWRTDPVALDAFYADRKLMWRNVLFIGLANLGWGLSLTIVGPLMAMKLLQLGVGENIQGTMNSINTTAVAFLVMLFSWMSDHTVSRIGRRKPYFYISAPFIILTIVLFPFFSVPRFVWWLLGMQVMYLLFMDLKNSTFSLIMIDCVPRGMLGRTSSIFGIAGGLMGFFANWFAGDLIYLGERVPYLLGGAVMVVTTLSAMLVREPPVYHPPAEPFKPWSTFKVAAQDKRIFWLMGGVAMIGAYAAINFQWLWFWAFQTLHLTRKDIFQAVAWAGLVNLVLSYPMGWVIDRFGGLRVVVIFFVLEIGCFFLTYLVHDKLTLTLLVLVQTIVFPLYGAADIMVFKSSPHKDIGSITSTNACLRNLFNGALAGITGWLIYLTGHNYHTGFMLGVFFSCVGMVFFIIHHQKMKHPTAPASASASVP